METYMNNRQKKRAIKDLEQNRQRELCQVYANYNNRNNQYQRGKKGSNRHKE